MAGEINFGLLDPNLPAKVANSFYEGQQQQRQNKLADLQMQGAQSQNELAKYSLSSAQRNDEIQNQMLQDLRAAGNDPVAIQNALIKAGKPQDAYKLQLDQANLGKIKADTGEKLTKTTHDTLAQYRDALSNVNTPDDAKQWLAAQYSDPNTASHMQLLGPIDQAISKIPQDPAGFMQWKTQAALGMGKYLEMNKPTIHMQNTGGASNIVAVPGLGGAPNVLSSTPLSASPADKAKAFYVDENGQLQENIPVQKFEMSKSKAGAANVKTVVNPAIDPFKNEKALREEYQGLPQVKSAAEMNTAFKMIETAYQRPSAANDLAMATKFMKILDPTSVVRESEFAMAVNATGLMDKVYNYANMIKTGQRLNPTQRKDFYDSARAINEAFQGEAQHVGERYKGIAGQYGLDPGNITFGTDFEKRKPAQNQPTQPGKIKFLGFE